MPKITAKRIITLVAAVVLGAALLAGGYYAVATLLVSAPQLDFAYHSPSELPPDTAVLYVNRMGKRGGQYYIAAAAAYDDETEYIFPLAEGFTARAFEPAAAGALHPLDYNSPKDFYAQWYSLAKRRDTLGTAFSFSFDGNAIDSLYDTMEPSPPNGPEY